MAHDIEYTLNGDDMQIVEIELDPGEAVRAEAGAMLYMDGPIRMDTGTGGGFMKGLKRRIAGESFFITFDVHPLVWDLVASEEVFYVMRLGRPKCASYSDAVVFDRGSCFPVGEQIVENRV